MSMWRRAESTGGGRRNPDQRSGKTEKDTAAADLCRTLGCAEQKHPCRSLISPSHGQEDHDIEREREKEGREG